MKKLYRREYHVYGEVQAVGFRFSATQLARRYGMTGWVRNEYDGSVTVVLQTDVQEAFDRFFHEINSGWIRISEFRFTEQEPVPDERGFSVKY